VRIPRQSALLFVILLLIIILVACQKQATDLSQQTGKFLSPTPPPIPTHSLSTSTRNAVPNLSALLPSRTATATFTASPTVTLTFTPSNTPTNTFTPSPTFTITPTFTPLPPGSVPVAPANWQPGTLGEFWKGDAYWALETPDTGLPIGESDTIYMGNGEYWSYLHASTESAGIHDSCGGEVEYPGCVTRWISLDGGRTFRLSEPRCLLACNSCPCDVNDHTAQQQYPRVARAEDGTFFMVYEYGAQTFITHSADGIQWTPSRWVNDTGIWTQAFRPCDGPLLVGDHPYFTTEWDCLAGAPPGIFIADGKLFIFVGLGENPSHMGCLWSPYYDGTFFLGCDSNPLFSGAETYGPLTDFGPSANPYFDFRFVSSADVVYQGGLYYMTYEGVRGPFNQTIGRDNQFALGFARSPAIDAPWEKYPDNPVLRPITDDWGIGHADLLIVDGVTYLYTSGTPTFTRGRWVLVEK